ncbi:hypothetical protein [Bradyrhizobium sp. AUGA SZCCT0283]|uniref:hypothetical protein n=1 Tax=Bradyrhizobium sp. AUGA SZCCT0283 TaxID=2807671 RepID=UPI001BA4C906|nr:hypothetical protein [Bradyrhizobium sp. AUGA SZCCT0283]MBR1279975.1 hypothetical protein [Bradyrhizobium sp. AUGA SZCCT0283]
MVYFSVNDITDPGGRLMGKRSNFERREADFHPRPRAAAPLIPYLRAGAVKTFAPCAGDGCVGATASLTG